MSDVLLDAAGFLVKFPAMFLPVTETWSRGRRRPRRPPNVGLKRQGLIKGHTGNVGKESTKALSARGVRYRAMVRSGKASNELSAMSGAEIVMDISMTNGRAKERG